MFQPKLLVRTEPAETTGPRPKRICAEGEDDEREGESDERECVCAGVVILSPWLWCVVLKLKAVTVR